MVIKDDGLRRGPVITVPILVLISRHTDTEVKMFKWIKGKV